MILLRNGNKRLHDETDMIELMHADLKITITEECDGAFRIHRNDGKIMNVVRRHIDVVDIY